MLNPVALQPGDACEVPVSWFEQDQKAALSSTIEVYEARKQPDSVLDVIRGVVDPQPDGQRSVVYNTEALEEWAQRGPPAGQGGSQGRGVSR